MLAQQTTPLTSRRRRERITEGGVGGVGAREPRKPPAAALDGSTCDLSV
mgnify:CR=1 FL=1